MGQFGNVEGRNKEFGLDSSLASPFRQLFFLKKKIFVFSSLLAKDGEVNCSYMSSDCALYLLTGV